ncbi:MAG: MMPL family transporter [Pirellulaceae bacterium]|nr:MMPL family transporter [Pirellulaceae bacterium]
MFSPPLVQRISNWAALVTVLGLIWAVWYAVQIKFGTDYVENWLPRETPSRVAYADFAKRFGEDQVLLLAWRGARLDDPRIVRATERLEELRLQNPHWPIVAITNSQQSIDQLRSKLSGLTEAGAIERLAGQAVGQDGSSFVAIHVRGIMPKERDQIVSSLTPLVRSLGIEPRDMVIAGEPYQTHIVDLYSRLSIQRFVPFSILLSMLVAWLCLRSWRLSLVVLALAGVGQLLGMALISATTGQMGAILIVVPTLLFMLTLSAAVHLVNYYVECRADGQGYPGARALKLGFIPCLLAALTTAIGFGSLVVSDLEPIFQFGALAGGGVVLATLLLLMLFVPITRLQMLGTKDTQPAQDSTFHLAECLVRFTTNRRRWIIAVGLVLFVATAFGIPRLKTTTRFDGMFEASHPSVRSLRWVEDRLGPIETMEFLVTFADQPQPVDVLEQLTTVRRLQNVLTKHNQVHSTFSAIQLLPPLPTQQGSRATVRRAVYRNLINADLDNLASAQLVSSSPTGNCWRITARFKTKIDEEFHRLRTELEQLSRAELEMLFPESQVRPALEITGLRTVIETANTVLMRDLISSFSTAFLLITPVMMIVARSIVGGLLLMIPNLIPVALVFGLMGWQAIPLDVASILTASVALGISVDDTLHCVYWYVRGKKHGASSMEATNQAIRHCARAMLFTTLISCGAMLPFMFCEFLPTGRFALLLILILAGAIIGDLILLPALLRGPMGRWVGRSL